MKKDAEIVASYLAEYSDSKLRLFASRDVSHLHMLQKKISCGSSSFRIAEKLHTHSTIG